MKPSSLSFVLALLATIAFGETVRGQCSTAWSSGALPSAPVLGAGRCSTLWDPDGAGPAPTRLVIGGSAPLGAPSPTTQVASFDGSQWQMLGPGPGSNSDEVQHLLSWNGVLVAAGNFAGGIAAWNGVAWLPLGPGLPNPPTSICEWNGNLVASTGNFGTVVKVWNGAAWTTLPAPGFDVHAMISYQGLLCVGGVGSGGGTFGRWNGTAWLPTIFANAPIECLATRTPFGLGTTSILYVGGSFSVIGPSGVVAARVASTTGGTAFNWSPIGSGLPTTFGVSCYELHARNIGATGFQLVALASGTTAQVMSSTGGSFSPLGTTPSNAFLQSLTYYANAYHAAFLSPTNSACLRYEAPNWVPVLGHSLDGEVRALVPSGADMIVGGTMQASAGVALNRIARWNGSTFAPLGFGLTGTSVDALVTAANGDIVAGGVFPLSGGATVNNIARWNGSSWSSLGTGTDLQVLALCRMPNGDIVAGGKFTTAGGGACARIARWNGASWSPLGLGMNGDVRALAVRSDGMLFAGGDFTVAGTASCSRIAQWNGSTWAPLGFGLNGNVHALAVRPNDDIVATGAFTTAVGVVTDRCVRWNGSAWFGMGAGSADATATSALWVLPDGDVVAGRGFHQAASNPDVGIARWGGFNWTGFGSGLAAGTPGNPVAVKAIAQRADGELIVGGNFGIAGGLVALGLAGLTSTCPAVAAPYGAGCAGATGPLVIAPESLPWIDSTFRTATTGMAPVSVGLGVTGFTQVAIPLASILPQGQNGCDLLASPDILSVLLADATGTARSALPLAPSASLVGTTFFQQSVPLDFSGAGAISAVRGSNALRLTIGVF